jgi:hypothetical protein
MLRNKVYIHLNNDVKNALDALPQCSLPRNLSVHVAFHQVQKALDALPRCSLPGNMSVHVAFHQDETESSIKCSFTCGNFLCNIYKWDGGGNGW